MHERQAILQLFADCAASVLATVVEVQGSAYRRAGARMLLTPDGRSAGVINGGCLDADLHRRSRLVLESGRAQLAVYDTTSPQDILFGLGLGCRGVVKILLEPAKELDWLGREVAVEVVYEGDVLGTRLVDGLECPRFETGGFNHSGAVHSLRETLEAPQRLFIFGAGADVVPLQRLAANVGWGVQTVDLRPPSPSRATFIESRHVAPENLGEFEVPPDAACVIMTHNFLHDLELLKRLLPSPAAYVGLLGPRRRAEELLAKIGGDTLLPGIAPTQAQLARFFAPIGLDCGAETPEEIALSIVAEIQCVKRGTTGGSLRTCSSIHGDKNPGKQDSRGE
jgi:xanthine/CO dehydrogenase XdhC/CoxF family maturation factor